ncbi:MAG: hypothetical protein ACI92G_000572 [Candidatus Pelagisphaera sp.]|jgi:hypothetical protein
MVKPRLFWICAKRRKSVVSRLAIGVNLPKRNRGTG